MNLEPKYVFLGNTITAAFFGITFFLMPEMTANLMGIMTDAQGYATAQFMGLGFLLSAAFVFSYRNVPHSTDRQFVFLALFLYFLFMVVLHVLYHSLTNPVVIVAMIIEGIWVVLYLILFIINMKKS
ncbi:MAG: hypothetical protein ACFFED_03060 [Candidatus Thorarchaeota archaeon]